MQKLCHTIRDLLMEAEASYSTMDAIRYKVKSESKEEKKGASVEARTYKQLKDDSECFSAVLAALGEQKNHIAILGTTSYEWIVSYFGIVNSGSTAVPLDALLPTEELCELLNRADVTVLVYDESKAEVAQAAKTACPGLNHVISMGTNSRVDGALSLWEQIGKQKPGFDYAPQPEELATIMFTSGTTGKSKGVMLTHQNLAENATCLDMKFEPGTVVMSVLPIHHAYCLSMDILKTLSTGAVICINDSLLRVAKNMKLYEPNLILLVPLLIETLA